MQQAQRLVEHEDEDALDAGALLGVAPVEAALRELDVPVAELVPEEVVERAGGLAELVGVDALVHSRGEIRETREDPAVRDLARLGCARLVALEVHHHEAAGVPDLVREVAAREQLVLGELEVLGARDLQHEAEAHAVGAVVLHEVERIDAGAERLAHPLALGVEDRGMDDDVVERDLAVDEVHAAHHHARDPQEEDVAGGREHVGGIEVVELRRLLGPAERGERPQLRREPRVEDVLVLAHVDAAALRARR